VILAFYGYRYTAFQTLHCTTSLSLSLFQIPNSENIKKLIKKGKSGIFSKYKDKDWTILHQMVPQNLRLNFRHIFCIPLTVSVVLSSAVPFPPAAAYAALSHHRSVAASASPMNPSSPLSQSHSPPPPVAKKVEHAMEMFGDVRIDNYYWLRDDSRTDPEVLSYLSQENAYTDSVMSGANRLFLTVFRFHCFCFLSILYLSSENTIRLSMQV